MQFNDMLAQTGGLQAMARELGVSEAQAASGTAAGAGAQTGGLDLGSVISNVAGGGVGGAILMIIVGVIKQAMAK